MQHLDLTALRYFSETAACGSIRTASDRLHVTPSAVSRQIAKLEYRLGTVLFERRASGVILTAAGELLSREVMQVYRNLSRLGDLIADLEGLRRGRVTIFCMEGAADAWLPSILSRFHELHPDITFDLHVENTDRAVEALLLGDCDIAVTLKTQRRSEIKVVKRHAEKLVALVHPAHPLSARRSIDLATLLKIPLVMPDKSFGVRQVLERCARKLGSSWVCVADVNSVAMAKSLARHGVGPTVLPSLSAAHDVSLGLLKKIAIADAPDLSAGIEVCVRADRPLTAAAKAVLREMSNSFDELFSA